jgi:hypothetical protein
VTEKISLFFHDGKNNPKVEALFYNNMLLLTQQQMAEPFKTIKQNISLHINNIFEESELAMDSVVKEHLITVSEVEKSYLDTLKNVEK